MPFDFLFLLLNGEKNFMLEKIVQKKKKKKYPTHLYLKHTIVNKCKKLVLKW